MGDDRRRCIECLWCGLRVEFDSGSAYCCAVTGEPILGPVLHRRVCADFSERPSRHLRRASIERA